MARAAAAVGTFVLGYQVLVQVFLARGRRSSSLMPPHTPRCRWRSAALTGGSCWLLS
jgi:hypothetical protein